MRTEQFIAKVIAEMAETKLEVGYVKDISKCIYNHKRKGQAVSGVTLQRTPVGFHSPEVAEFVGRLVTVGLASQGSPVIITKEGVEWLKRLATE